MFPWSNGKERNSLSRETLKILMNTQGKAGH
jgi:hypothetical protein